MNGAGAKATPAERKGLEPVAPRPPTTQPTTGAQPATDLAALQAGPGNAALAAAVTTGTIGSNPLELQSTLGNGLAAQAAAVTGLRGEKRQNRIPERSPASYLPIKRPLEAGATAAPEPPAVMAIAGKSEVAPAPIIGVPKVSAPNPALASEIRSSYERPAESRAADSTSTRVTTTRAMQKVPAASALKAGPGPTSTQVPFAPKAGADSPAPPAAAEGNKEVSAKKKVLAYEPSPPVPLPAFVLPPLDADVSSLPEETTLASPAPEPPVLAAGPYKPDDARAEISALLEQLHASGELRGGEIRAEADRAKAEIFQEGEARKESVRNRVEEELSLIQGEIATTRQAVQQEATLQKALGSLNIAMGMLTVLANTAIKSQAITALGMKHKQSASDAVTSRQKTAREFGVSEGKRGKEAIDGQANEAWQRGQAKAGGYPDDDRGQAQAEAVLKVAAEYYEKLKEPGPDLQENMEDAGEELADGLDGAQDELVQQIDEQVPQITGDLSAQSLELLPQFTRLQTELGQTIDDFVADINSQLDEVEAAAAAELLALESQIVSQIDQSVLLVTSLIDSATEVATTSVDSTVTRTVEGLKAQKRPHPGRARTAIEKTDQAIQTTANFFREALGQSKDTVCEQLGSGADGVEQGVAVCAANVVSSLGTVSTAALDGLGQIGMAAKDSSDKIVEEWDKMLSEAETAVDTQFGEAVTGFGTTMDQGLDPAEAKMTAQVDEAVEKNRAPLDELDGKMEEAAKEARDKYDAPWYEKVGRWVWNAIKAIVWAVVVLLVLVIIVIAAIVLIIVGFIKGIVVLIVIGVLAIIAAVVWVLYNIIKGIVNRVKSANTWYGAIWGVVVGILDIVGIPGVIEGIIHRDIVNGRKLSEEEAGERFGTGLVAVILLLLPLKGKFGKAPKAPVEVPPLIPEGPVVPKGPVEVPVGRELPKVPEGPKVPETPSEAPKIPETPKIPEKPAEPPKVPEKPAEPPKVPEKPAEPAKVPEKPPEPPKVPEKPVEPPKESKATETPSKPKKSDKPKEAGEPKKPPKEGEGKPGEKAPEVPKEPTTPKEVEKAKFEEAEAAETAKRPKVETLAELEKLKKDPPLKEKPPERADPELWDDGKGGGYVNYWHERVKLLEEELKSPAEPGAKPKTSPPLPWDAYSAFRGKFKRGRVFEDKVTEKLAGERPDLRIEQDVGVKKAPAEGAAEGAKNTTKFADQLGVDKAKLEAWEKAGRPKEGVPDVESFSNKSREFAKMSEADRAGQVAADVLEAIDKYGGEVEIRRPGHPLFGMKPKVSKVTLIYDAKLAPAELRPAIEAAARDAAAEKGVPVEVKFMDVPETK